MDSDADYFWDDLDLQALTYDPSSRRAPFNEISVHLIRRYPLPPREDSFLVKLLAVTQQEWDSLQQEEKIAVRAQVRDAVMAVRERLRRAKAESNAARSLATAPRLPTPPTTAGT